MEPLDIGELLKTPAKKSRVRARAPEPEEGGSECLKPAPTKRKWRGEQWYLDKDGRCCWGPAGEVEVSYYNWYMTFLNDPGKYSPYWPPGEMHREIGDVLDNLEVGDAIQLLAQRDSLKSTFTDEGYSLYAVLERWDAIGQKGVLVVCWADELMKRTYTNVVEHLMQNERVITFYGYVIDDEKTGTARGAKSKRKFTGNMAYFRYQQMASAPGLMCTTFSSGSITGFHPGLAILDDIEDEPLSAVYMRKFKNVILKKLIPAVSLTGIIIITGTVKGWDATNDCYILLEKSEAYQTYRYPAVTAQNSPEPLFPPMDDVKYHLEPVPVLNKRTGRPLFDRFKRPVFKHVPVVDFIKDRQKYRVTYFEKFTLEMLVGIRIKFRLGEEKDKNDDDFFSEYQLQAMNPAGKVFKMHRIFTAPPVLDSERLFESYEDFRNFYEPTGSIPVYMFLDPGGKTSHGIAVVVAAVVQGERWGALKWVVLDAVVLRVGLVDVAVKCVELVKKWRVDQFGVEGGFDQPEAYASTIDREMRRYCERNNMLQYYRTPCSPANDKNKLQRINTQISSILGHEEQPPSFYLNPKCEAFERIYNQEFRGFGFDVKAAEEHEFDLLDCLASIRIHMVGADQGSDVLAEGFGYQEMI